MRRLNQVSGIDTGTNLVAERPGEMKNCRDNGEGVKHGVVHLQLGHYEIKTGREVLRIITDVKWAVKEQMKT